MKVKSINSEKEKRDRLKVVLLVLFGFILISWCVGWVKGQGAGGSPVYESYLGEGKVTTNPSLATNPDKPIPGLDSQTNSLSQVTYTPSSDGSSGVVKDSKGMETPVSQNHPVHLRSDATIMEHSANAPGTGGGETTVSGDRAGTTWAESPSGNPQPQVGPKEPTAPSGPGGGGGGAGGEGGKPGDAAVGAAQQGMGIASSALGAIKDILATNGKGNAAMELGDGAAITLNDGAEVAIIPKESVPSGGLCDYSEKLVCGNITYDCTRDTNKTVKNSDNSTNSSGLGSAMTVDDCITGENIVKDDCFIRSICTPRRKSFPGTILAQNDKTKSAETKVSEDGTLLKDSKNLEARVIDQANIYTPNDERTNILLKGTTGNPEPLSNPRNAEVSSSTTGKAIADLDSSGLGGQYVKLVKHDLDMSGKDLKVQMFKSFNEVEAFGRNLEINNGNVDILINNQKIYYPREIKEAPYFMNKVTNFMDKENYFRLRLGGQVGGYLVDSRRFITVGDSTIPHPKLKGFVIAKERELMFNNV